MSYTLKVKVTTKEEARNLRHLLQTMRVVEEVTEPEEEKFDREGFLAALREVQKVNPFRDIEGPVEWQRNQRDEWERDWERSSD